MSRDTVTLGRDTQSDTNVTLEKSREERERTESRENGHADEPHIEAWLMVKHRLPTQRQRDFLDRYLQVFDVTGPQRMAALILSHPDDPIAALKEDLDAHREERLGEMAAWTPAPKAKAKREPWQEQLREVLAAQEAELQERTRFPGADS